MDTILKIQISLKKLYARYSKYIDIEVKFLLALVSYYAIGNSINGFKLLNNPFVLLLLAVGSAFIPTNFTIVIGCILILLHLAKLSVGAMAVAAAVIVVLMILYLRFTPKMFYVILLTPIAFALHIPFAIPMAIGMVYAPYAFIATTAGTIAYFMLHNVSLYYKVIQNADGLSGATTFISKVFADSKLIIYLLLYLLIILVVYAFKKSEMDRGREIAIAVSSVIAFIGMFIGNTLLKADISVLGTLIGVVAGAIVAYVAKVFVFSVDYKKIRHVQYEDDEYVYYVKAVPKVMVKHDVVGE